MKLASSYLILLGLTTSLLVGCGDNGGDSDGEDQIAGKIQIEGSSTVEPISNEAKAAFNKEVNDKITITVSGQGTSNGFKTFQKGETDISDASRPIKQKELDGCKENGVKFVEIPVAYDGLTFAVNKDNEAINELTVDQLKKIFVEGGATKWNEVDPGFPAEDIKVYIPGTGSGTYDYAHEVLAKKDDKKLRSETEIVTMSEDDNILVDGVKKDKFGIGFFGFAYYEANKNDLKAVKIVNPDGKAVEPAMETIESGEYAPFSRPLFIYVNTESYGGNAVKLFVDYYLDNAKKLAVAAKYVALPDEIYEAAKKNLRGEEPAIGTHFLDEEGEKRSGSLTDIFKPENLKY